MQQASPTLAETLNHPLLWIGALAVLAVIVVQSVLYYRAAQRAAVSVGMPKDEVRLAFRSGGTAAIGPSIAVCLVALALLPVFGTPSTITRIGLIGSAAYETMAANVALGTMGSSLGADNVTGSMALTMLLALAIGGSGWMMVTLVLTPLARRSGRRSAAKQAAKSRGAGRWAVLPVAALVGAFFTMGIKEISAGFTSALVIFTSAAVMALMTWLAHKLKRPVLTEYALGVAMLVSIAVGYLAS